MKVVQKTLAWFSSSAAKITSFWPRETPLKYDSSEETPVHHAFKVAADDFNPAVEFLRQSGVRVFHIEDRRDGVFGAGKPTF